jgi:hypothetical protein
MAGRKTEFHFCWPCSRFSGGQSGAHLGGGAAQGGGGLGRHLFQRLLPRAGGVELGGEAGAVGLMIGGGEQVAVLVLGLLRRAGGDARLERRQRLRA